MISWFLQEIPRRNNYQDIPDSENNIGCRDDCVKAKHQAGVPRKFVLLTNCAWLDFAQQEEFPPGINLAACSGKSPAQYSA